LIQKSQVEMPSIISDFFKQMPKLKATKDSNSTILNDAQFINYDKNFEKLIKEEKCIKLETIEIRSNSCEFCQKIFKNNSVLVQHKKNMHSDKVNFLGCNLCDRKFLNKKGLDRHMTKYHASGEIQIYECDFDGKMFKNKGFLLKHMDVHVPKVECEVCHIFVRKANLNNHLITHFGSGQQFQCNFCSKSFKTKVLLKSHKQLHVKKFECEICKKMFSHLRHLKKHKKEIHDNPGSFECLTCGKIFNGKGGLKAHQVIHDKFAKKHLKCQKCNYKTNIKRNFEEHLNVHKRKEAKFAAMKNPLKCDKCFVYCSTEPRLRHHLLYSHPENPYQCDLCGKYLKTKLFLKNHMKICVNKKIKK